MKRATRIVSFDRCCPSGLPILYNVGVVRLWWGYSGGRGGGEVMAGWEGAKDECSFGRCCPSDLPILYNVDVVRLWWGYSGGGEVMVGMKLSVAGSGYSSYIGRDGGEII